MMPTIDEPAQARAKNPNKRLHLRKALAIILY